MAEEVARMTSVHMGNNPITKMMEAFFPRAFIQTMPTLVTNIPHKMYNQRMVRPHNSHNMVTQEVVKPNMVVGLQVKHILFLHFFVLNKEEDFCLKLHFNNLPIYLLIFCLSKFQTAI